ncbi:integrase, catalytic region, zinc finger, CCHC-type containing protein [Tanacetum coccineum]
MVFTMSNDKESSATGTDNRPPMLVEDDYESWRIRIERYIRGEAATQVIRDKTDEEFDAADTNKELADIQEANILRKSLQRRQEELFDEYERFRANGNELIHDYFAKYVTNAKNNQDLSAVTYVDLFTYLRTYETHAMKTLKKQEQSSSLVDPLAYLAKATHHQTPTQTIASPPLPYIPSTSSYNPAQLQTTQSTNDAMLATMNQIVNLLSGFQKQFPPTNNQLRTSSNLRTHATVHDGQIVTETVQRRALGNVGNTSTRGTQNYGQVTDNKGKLVICYNCRGEGHVSRQCKEKKRAKDS